MSPYIIQSIEEFGVYFPGEWPRADSGRSVTGQNVKGELVAASRWLSDFYGRAVASGYHVPASLLYNIHAALIGRSYLLRTPESGSESEVSRSYQDNFLRCIRTLPLWDRVAASRETGLEIPDESALWEAVLAVLRRSRFVCPDKPLYPPEYLRKGLLEYGQDPSPGGRMGPDHPLWVSLSQRLADGLGEPGRSYSPYFYFVEGDSGESGSSGFVPKEDPRNLQLANLVVQDARAVAPLRPALGAPARLHARAISELASIKYASDYVIRDDEELIRRIRQLVQLAVKTLDPEFFPTELEVITRTGPGPILPSELANDWEILCHRLVNDEVLRLTSRKREHPPMQYRVHLDFHTDWTDQGLDSWDGIPVGDHLHALALLIFHDILYYLRKVPLLTLHLHFWNIRVPGMDFHPEDEWVGSSVDIFSEDFDPEASPFLLVNAATTGLAGRGDILGPVTPSDSRGKGSPSDSATAESRSEFRVRIQRTAPVQARHSADAGDEEGAPTHARGMALGSCWVTVNEKETECHLLGGEGHWAKVNLLPPGNQAAPSPQELEQRCRIRVLLALLDNLDCRTAELGVTSSLR